MATNICRTPSNVCIEGIEDPPITSSAGSIPSTELIVREDLSSPFSFRPFAHALYEHTDSFGRSVRIFAVNSGASLAQQLPRTSFVHRLQPIEFESRHDFQVQEASTAGGFLVFLALATAFGRRVPQRSQTPGEIPVEFREVYRHFETLYERRTAIPQILETLRARLQTPPDRHVGVTDAYRLERQRLALQIRVLETMQGAFENSEGGSLPSAAGLVQRLTESAWNEALLGPRPASFTSQTLLDVEIDSIARVRREVSEQLRAVNGQLETHQASLSRYEQEVRFLREDEMILRGGRGGDLHYRYPSTSGFGSELYHNGRRLSEALRTAEEYRAAVRDLEARRVGAQTHLAETALVHDSLQFIRNLHALEENAFRAAFGEFSGEF